MLGIDKYVRDTGAVLPAEDQTALDAWLPLARTTLGVTQRDEPFRNGVPIVQVAFVPLADDVELEVTGETGAAGEYTEDQVNLMLALAQGEMHADLLAAKLGISEEGLAALVRDTDCVSSMMKDDV